MCVYDLTCYAAVGLACVSVCVCVCVCVCARVCVGGVFLHVCVFVWVPFERGADVTDGNRLFFRVRSDH